MREVILTDGGGGRVHRGGGDHRGGISRPGAFVAISPLFDAKLGAAKRVGGPRQDARHRLGAARIGESQKRVASAGQAGRASGGVRVAQRTRVAERELTEATEVAPQIFHAKLRRLAGHAPRDVDAILRGNIARRGAEKRRAAKCTDGGGGDRARAGARVRCGEEVSRGVRSERRRAPGGKRPNLLRRGGHERVAHGLRAHQRLVDVCREIQRDVVGARRSRKRTARVRRRERREHRRGALERATRRVADVHLVQRDAQLIELTPPLMLLLLLRDERLSCMLRSVLSPLQLQQLLLLLQPRARICCCC